MFLGVVNLKADCNTDKEIAKNMYIDGIALLADDDTIDIYIELYGLTEDMYAEYYNTFTGETLKYTWEDFKEENGNLYLVTKTVTKPSNFSVTIYSNSCGSDKLRTYEYQYGTLNKYAVSDFCKDNQHKSDWCKGDANTEGMTEEEVKKKVERDVKLYDAKAKVQESVKKYYLYVLIPFLLVILIYAIRIYLFKKKQDEKLS
jgi:hypothetical protein